MSAVNRISTQDYRYVLVEKILQVATENNLIIYGDYVRDVLVRFKARLPLTVLITDINFLTESITNWNAFVTKLGSFFDVIKDDITNEYKIAVLGNVICEGQLLLNMSSYQADIDIDLLMCDEFNELGVSLYSFDDEYTAEQLIDQIIRKEFRVINDRPGPSLYERENELYTDNWTNLTIKEKEEQEEKKEKIRDLLASNRLITAKLSDIYGSTRAIDQQSKMSMIIREVLKLSELMEKVLHTFESLDK